MKIAVVNDLSGMGRCSLTASIPLLNALGHQVFPVPTAILSNQTGYDKYTFFDFTPYLPDYIGNWKDMGVKFDCVYSGFLSNVAQGEMIIDLYKNCGTDKTTLVIDPVMGDDGLMYATFDDSLCAEVKKLAAMADIITPNLTEACMLTGVDYAEFNDGLTDDNFYDRFYDLAGKCAAFCKGKAVVTGIAREEGLRYVYNFAVSDEGRFFTKNRMYGGHYSGTGDITASIITGQLMRGKKLRRCVETAADFVEEAVKDAFHHGVDKNDGVNFEKFLPLLCL